MMLLTEKSHNSHHQIPKGCMVIRIGKEGEEQERFVVPVLYLNHPLFLRLLKEAEEEYGFEQKGAITIPCQVEYFRQVRGLIDKEFSFNSGREQHHDHQFHISGCFRA